MSGFTDKIQQADGITITLNCGLCGQVAGKDHDCASSAVRPQRICEGKHPVDARCDADKEWIAVSLPPKRYMRTARIVLVRCLANPSSNEPDDLFLVELEKGGEQYTTTRAIIERDYQEI